MKLRFALLGFMVLLAGCSGGRSVVAARYDLCFREDYPGASDRYVEYTPVRCSDPNIKVADPIGGERASLEVVAGDEYPEVIISSEFWCRSGKVLERIQTRSRRRRPREN